MRQIFSRKRCVFTVCALCLCVAQRPVLAQMPDPQSKPQNGVLDRISFGLRGSVLLLAVQNNRSATTLTSSSNPPLDTLEYSNNASKRFGGGPTIQFDFSPKLSLNADFLYRRLGYDAGRVVNTQATDKEKAKFVSGDYERTRGDLWDVPVMMRYYRGPVEDEEGRRSFVAGGIALRTLSGIRSFNQRVNDKGLSDSTTAPATPLRSTVPGVVVGAGWQFRDEVGVKVDLELRYTRWLQRLFDARTAQSNANQAEILIGFTF